MGRNKIRRIIIRSLTLPWIVVSALVALIISGPLYRLLKGGEMQDPARECLTDSEIAALVENEQRAMEKMKKDVTDLQRQVELLRKIADGGGL